MAVQEADFEVMQDPWRSVKRVLLVNAAIGLAVTGLHLTLERWGGWDWLRAVVLANLLYANVLGGLAALVIPPVAVRVSTWKPLPRWSAYLGALVAVGLAGPLLASAALVLFGFARNASVWLVYRRSVGLALLLVMVIGLVAYILERLRYQAEASTRALRVQQLERERAEKLAAEARLASLESRLQPHFLFNTINSILSLMREDPAAAESMLERLSRLLRFALDNQRRGLVPLAEELRLVEDYLEIERVRFGERLRFAVDCPEESLRAQVPAYAVQTLVENAMKYAVAARRAGGEITVRAGREDRLLRLEVADNGPGFSRDELREGHGLDTLEKRLETLFEGRARIVIGNGSGGASVTLEIPWREANG